jgi:hypothetical protein
VGLAAGSRVRREVRQAADGGGQAGGASGCGLRGLGVWCVGLPGSAGVVVRWCVGLQATGVRQEVCLAARGGGQVGGASG